MPASTPAPCATVARLPHTRAAPNRACLPSNAAALDAGIDARPLRNETTLSELVLVAPEIQNPLVGYHGGLLSVG